MRVSNVYKTLGVGVCSCVYSACPEIVTELRKQFTVNKPFPCSNKGPMRLNSVPASQPPQVMKNRIPIQPKHSEALLYFIAFAASAWALPMIVHTLQLVLVHGCVEKCNSGGQGATICPGMSYSWSASWQMNTVVGVMGAPGKLPLIKELQKGVGRSLLSTLRWAYQTCWAPTLGLQLGKWMDTSGRVMDEWGEISKGVAKAK